MVFSKSILLLISVKVLYSTSLNNSFIVDAPCNETLDCNSGSCQDNICVCNEGYDHTIQDNETIPCSYKLHGQFETLILESFVGFGAEEFYTQRYFRGILKLISYLLAILSIFLFPMIISKVYNRFKNKIIVYTVASMFSLLAVWFSICFVSDLVLIKNGVFIDGKGHSLYPWK